MCVSLCCTFVGPVKQKTKHLDFLSYICTNKANAEFCNRDLNNTNIYICVFRHWYVYIYYIYNKDNKDDIVSRIILNNPCKYVSHFYVVVIRNDVKCWQDLVNISQQCLYYIFCKIIRALKGKVWFIASKTNVIIFLHSCRKYILWTEMTTVF